MDQTTVISIILTSIAAFLVQVFSLALLIFIQIQHILMGILAIQKFLLFFFPDLEKSLTVTVEEAKNYLKILYFLVSLICCGFISVAIYYLFVGRDTDGIAIG
uniref:7TM_GPCR_Srx domain-containing protein n=1 Tax=Caenorhabditis tropicalis TaxID=1561998 RepID=A0A1I7TUR6_9PELO